MAVPAVQRYGSGFVQGAEAAQEMKNRISKMVHVGNVNDFVCTIHGFCVKFLREEIFRLGFPSNFAIIDEEDSKTLSKQIFTDGVNSIQAVVNLLNQEDKIDIEGQVLYTPFEQQFMDYLAGVYATVEITTESPIGLCSINKYEYEDDKDKLIERLIEEINKYKTEDAELSLLLQEILHKISGEVVE